VSRQQYQGTPAWLEERHGGIGASDVPTLIAGSPEDWRTLFAVKLGLLPDQPAYAPEAAEMGHRLEPLLAALYTEREGHRVQRVNRILRHPEHDFIRASLDRRRKGVVVQLKARRFRDDEWGPDGSDQVPDAIAYQETQEMLVAGVERADVAVLFSGLEFRVYRLGLDRTLADELIALETRAWAYVARGELPPYPGPAPIRPVLAAGEIPADPDTTAAVLAWHAAEQLRAESEASADAIKDLLRERLAIVEAVRGDGFRISYRPSKDRTTVAWEQVASAYRKAMEEYGVDPAWPALIESTFTTTTPGARPLRITIEKGALTHAG